MDCKLINDKMNEARKRQKLNEAKKVTVINVSNIQRTPIKRKEIDITKL